MRRFLVQASSWLVVFLLVFYVPVAQGTIYLQAHCLQTPINKQLSNSQEKDKQKQETLAQASELKAIISVGIQHIFSSWIVHQTPLLFCFTAFEIPPCISVDYFRFVWLFLEVLFGSLILPNAP
ncbi:MAG: hypothetical protein RMJ44_08490 [Cytophagales bacterium]|nr:hypothetical protein [Bernardetiaceae bacterium]MDW8211110.1 hypothetical protein [Cytophagales bacterium]